VPHRAPATDAPDPADGAGAPRAGRASRTGAWLAIVLIAVLTIAFTGQPADAQPVPPSAPIPGADSEAATTDASVTLELPDVEGAPSQSVLIIIGLTLLSVAPALLIMVTSFTRIVIVLTLTRNALGLQGVPPNQVLAGLALFLSFFVMAPTLTKVNDDALQPLLDGKISQGEAWDEAVVPIRAFMLAQVRDDELELFVSATEEERPGSPEDVSLAALVPAFVLSELKTAFIIGFIVFIPFLVIDIVVSSSLMSMGMMMLPPTLVSLPFKLLLFVMVDGWGLVVRSLLTSFSP
jgi:flagellar biosynthetic protein FliP